MAKAKFEFNKKTLTYEKVEVKLKDKLRRLGSWVAYSLLLIFLSIKIYPYFIDSPKETELKQEINQMKFHYDKMKNEVSFLSDRLSEIQDRDDNIYRTIFEAEPIPSSIRKAGYGGVNRYKHLEGYSYSDQVVELRKEIDKLTKQLAVQSESLDKVEELAKNKVDMLASIPGIQPISNKDLKRVASGFGMRLHPVHKIKKMHTGIDFSAPRGAEIYATGDGIIVKIQYARNGYGKHVIVDHGFGYQTLYGHMSDYNVRRGQKVKRGDVLGYVGNTGTSTSPHLHYEVIKDGKKINPISYFYNDLTPQQYEEMIKICSARNQSFD